MCGTAEWFEQELRMQRTDHSFNARDPLFRTILGTGVLILLLYAGLSLVAGPGEVVLQIPWYNPIMSAFQALAAASVAFLALGRYRVLRDPVSYWTGLGFATATIALIFYELTWPGLKAYGGAVLSRLTSTALWTGRVGPMVLSVVLLAAVLMR